MTVELLLAMGLLLVTLAALLDTGPPARPSKPRPR